MKLCFYKICLPFIALFLGGCQSEEKDTFPETAAQFQLSQSEIIERVNAAADWQLAHMKNFESYVPSLVHRTQESRGWVQGTFFLGLARWAEATDNNTYYEYLSRHGNEQGWQLGPRVYHADDHVIAQYYLHLYERDRNPEQLAATKTILDQILANQPESSLDFEPRGKFRDQDYEHDCQKRWCWSDALFMSPPVWFHLSNLTGDPKYAEYAHQEFVDVTDYLFDEADSLYLRDSRFFERREENGAKIYWSRGNGWVYAGLTKIIDSLKNDDPRKRYYIDLFKKMSASLIEKQRENGYWPVSLAAGEIYTADESSGTAFFVAGLAWGINQGILVDNTFQLAVDKGWNALLAAQQDDGMLGYVQQIGYAPDKVSQNDTQLYGAGAFLFAGVQMLALSKN